MIYGADQQTLEQVAINNLNAKGWQLAVLEAGMDGELVRRLAVIRHPFVSGKVLIKPLESDILVELLRDYRRNLDVEVAVGVTLHPGPERQEVAVVMITPEGKQLHRLSYGGPPGYASRWAVNQTLDLMRKL